MTLNEYTCHTYSQITNMIGNAKLTSNLDIVRGGPVMSENALAYPFQPNAGETQGVLYPDSECLRVAPTDIYNPELDPQEFARLGAYADMQKIAKLNVDLASLISEKARIADQLFEHSCQAIDDAFGKSLDLASAARDYRYSKFRSESVRDLVKSVRTVLFRDDLPQYQELVCTDITFSHCRDFSNYDAEPTHAIITFRKLDGMVLHVTVPSTDVNRAFAKKNTLYENAFGDSYHAFRYVAISVRAEEFASPPEVQHMRIGYQNYYFITSHFDVNVVKAHIDNVIMNYDEITKTLFDERHANSITWDGTDYKLIMNTTQVKI